MTDGVSEPGDFASLAKKIADGNIGASIVGLGPDADRKLLREIEEKSKGRCYFCENARTLPRIFASETRAAAKVGITEGPCFVHTAQADESSAGIDFNRTPALSGHVETRLKPGSRLCLVSGSGDPLLAARRYGEGRSATFTSDLEGHWSNAWLRWEGLGVFWTQLSRAIGHAISGSRDSGRTQRERPKLPSGTILSPNQRETTDGSLRPRADSTRTAPADLFATAEDAVPWTEALGPFLLTAALLIFLIDFAFLRVLRQRVLIGQTMGRQIPRDGDGKYKSERPIAARPLVSKCRRQDLNLHSLNEN